MGYFTIGFINLLVATVITTFMIIVHLEQIMSYMKTNRFGYSESSYSGVEDFRYLWLLIPGIVLLVFSYLIWPVVLIIEIIGLMFYIYKDDTKLKKILLILREKN